MKKIALGVLSLSCALLVASAFGQNDAQKHPCDEALSQADMNQCAGREYRAADAELNKTYSRLSARLDAKAKAKLKQAEAAWINYRDANCEVEAYPNLGGSIYPFIYSGCLSRMTKARTAELQSQIEDRNL
jgi:uncharacterized protein YecT (DUF1311 family)